MATRILSYVPFLVLTLLCVGGVELFYRGVERFLLDPVISGGKVAEKAAEPEMSKPGTQKLAVDYSIITSRNLFGPPPAAKGGAQGEAPPAEKELEATSLELVLMGTIGGDEQGARAIILNKKDRKQELYHVGDTVEGAEIKDIQRGKVILHIDDRDEMLDMSEASQYGQNVSAPAAASPAVRRRPILGSPQQLPESIGQEQQPVIPRVVRPSRRIVRPQAEISAEEEGPAEEPPAEEPSPEMQEQEQQPPEATGQEAAPAQENEEQDARQY